MEINFFRETAGPEMFKSIGVIFLILLLCAPCPALALTISGPDVRLLNNDIFASFSFVPDEKMLGEIRAGIDKEIRLYIDLFRAWSGWPDEFVTGKSFVRTLRADPIKKEFLGSSFDGAVVTEKRFRSFESMIAAMMSVKDLKITNTRELEPGQYFVRITVESRVRKLPPVIGHFLIFLNESEFKIRKDSSRIIIEGGR